MDQAMNEVRRLRKEAQLAIRTRALKNIVERVQRKAVNDYMIKGGGAPDSEKLTIRSGNLANAVLNETHPSHVEEINTTSTGTRFRAMFGVKDDDITPYASTHEAGRSDKHPEAEFGGIDAIGDKMHFTLWNGQNVSASHVDIPPRSYMRPALNDVVNKDAADVVDDEIERIIRKMAFIHGF